MFGERLRELRESRINPLSGRKMTQQDLADEFKLAKSTISQYENNINEPDLKTVKLFAEYFGVDTDYLLETTDTPRKSAEEFLDKFVELSDEEILETTTFTFKGKPISKEKMHAILQLLRVDAEENTK